MTEIVSIHEGLSQKTGVDLMEQDNEAITDTNSNMSLEVLVDDVLRIIILYIKKPRKVMCFKLASKRHNNLINNIVANIKYKYRANWFCAENTHISTVKYTPLENHPLRSIIIDLQHNCYARNDSLSIAVEYSAVLYMARTVCMICNVLSTSYFRGHERYLKVTSYDVDHDSKIIDKITVEYVEICSKCLRQCKPHIYTDGVYHFSYTTCNRNGWNSEPTLSYTVRRVEMLCNNP